MAQRKTYVYSLDIVLPEEVDADIAIREWNRDCPPGFRWPRNRKFLSEAAAHRRAALYREYGASVVIIRSEPVEFPDVAGARQIVTQETIAGLRKIEQDLR